MLQKTARKAFEVRLKGITHEALADYLATAIEDADNARSATAADVSYWHVLYEQGRTRGQSNQPWQDAADLTSYLATQYVDALRARIVDTIFVEPVYTVEGWGDAAQRAPFVEEFHQWQIEEEGFQAALSKAIHLSLIEPRGVLEVYEDTIRRPIRKTIHARLQLDEMGRAVIGPDLKPVFEQSEDGRFTEATSEDEPQAELEIDSVEVLCRGPRHRAIPYRDFLVLPGHARDKSEIWGYAKRFHRRVDELQERAKAGYYDKEAVNDLGDHDERASETTLAGENVAVAQKRDGREEKELHELLFLKDLDGKGLRWFVTTLSVTNRTLLRLQYDDIGKPRFFGLTPWPRPNSTEGYSLVGHKLITSIEEHTAWRNMDADRESLRLQMPIKRLENALWDPEEEPFGAKAVITVRNMGEVEPMQGPVGDSGALERMIGVERGAEKIVGMTDLATGVSPKEDRTLGETQLVTEQSFIRIKEAIKNIQEDLEGIAQVRHIMWKRALKDMEAEGGLEAPGSVIQALTMRGVQMPGQAPPPMTADPQMAVGTEARGPNVLSTTPNLKFTAAMLEGVFRFKPRGSVETADKNRQRMELSQLLNALAALSKVNPMIGMILSMPQAAKALLEQVIRLYNVQDKQAFIGSDVQMAAVQALQAQQQQAQQQQMGQQQQQQAEEGDMRHRQGMDRAKMEMGQAKMQDEREGRQFDQQMQMQQRQMEMVEPV